MQAFLQHPIYRCLCQPKLSKNSTIELRWTAWKLNLTLSVTSLLVYGSSTPFSRKTLPILINFLWHRILSVQILVSHQYIVKKLLLSCVFDTVSMKLCLFLCVTYNIISTNKTPYVAVTSTQIWISLFYFI